MTKRSLPMVLSTVVMGAFLSVSEAHAQAALGFRGWGLRGGATVDPDQIHVGLHIDAGQFAPRVRFQPSFDVGFGDDVVVGTMNLDALYMFRAKGWYPYLGGGLGVAFIDFDSDRGNDGVEVEAGLNLVGGFEWAGGRYLLEARVGVGDIPELKITAGINF